MQWLRRLFRRERDTSSADRELQAKAALNKLRREELSLGAQARSGTAPNRVYGQASNRRTAEANSPLSSGPQSDGENFPLSMAVGAASGSAALGYLSGGSITGALLGSAMSDQEADTSRRSDSSCTSTWSGSDSGSSSSSSDSSSWGDSSSSSSSFD